MRSTSLLGALMLASLSMTQDAEGEAPAPAEEPSGGNEEPSNYDTILLAHAILLPLAFAFFYPVGSMIVRAFNFRKLVWFHAGWMVFTYMLVLTGMGLGIWMALTTDQLGEYHAIIGLVVSCVLIFQPITGLIHHFLYKRKGKANVATYPHIWWGRAVITLGIINGGFGLQLTGHASRGQYIGYGVGAGVMWLLWMAVIVAAFVKSRGHRAGETGEKVFGSGTDSEKATSAEVMRGSESGSANGFAPGSAQ